MEKTESVSHVENKNLDIKVEENTILAILSYLGPLWLVPYFMKKQDDFIKFHLGQGGVIFGLEVVLIVFENFFVRSFMLGGIINLAFLGLLGLSIWGIVNVVQKKKMEIPVIGQFSKYIPQ